MHRICAPRHGSLSRCARCVPLTSAKSPMCFFFSYAAHFDPIISRVRAFFALFAASENRGFGFIDFDDANTAEAYMQYCKGKGFSRVERMSSFHFVSSLSMPLFAVIRRSWSVIRVAPLLQSAILKGGRGRAGDSGVLGCGVVYTMDVQ